MGLYLISVSLPKEAFVGTGAWFFLLINLIKVPFSLQRHLITVDSLGFNALMIPCIIVGLLVGKQLIPRIPQKAFDTLVIVFAVVASLRLLRVF
jgi:uncharacterized membrane protein YfcA